MTTQEPNSLSFDTMLTPKFQQIVSGYHIDLPCVISTNKKVKVQDLYHLVDFLDNNTQNVRTVRFWQAYLKGHKVTLILMDVKSGEILKRSHRHNNDTLPCDWVLTDLFTKPDYNRTLGMKLSNNHFCERY